MALSRKPDGLAATSLWQLSAAPHAAAAAIGGRRRHLRLRALGDLIGVTLDPDHRQNDNSCGFALRLGADEPHDTPLIGEFDNDAHQPNPQPAGHGPPARSALSASSRLSGMQG